MMIKNENLNLILLYRYASKAGYRKMYSSATGLKITNSRNNRKTLYVGKFSKMTLEEKRKSKSKYSSTKTSEYTVGEYIAKTVKNNRKFARKDPSVSNQDRKVACTRRAYLIQPFFASQQKARVNHDSSLYFHLFSFLFSLVFRVASGLHR
jgi:hypothetical protein